MEKETDFTILTCYELVCWKPLFNSLTCPAAKLKFLWRCLQSANKTEKWIISDIYSHFKVKVRDVRKAYDCTVHHVSPLSVYQWLWLCLWHKLDVFVPCSFTTSACLHVQDFLLNPSQLIFQLTHVFVNLAVCARRLDRVEKSVRRVVWQRSLS